MKKEQPSFEESMKKLEELVRKLEDPEIPLQEGFALYQEGMKLTAGMKRELNEIEKQIKILQKNGRGEIEETDFIEEEKDELS